jgi:hypothetical protein
LPASKPCPCMSAHRQATRYAACCKHLPTGLGSLKTGTEASRAVGTSTIVYSTPFSSHRW